MKHIQVIGRPKLLPGSYEGKVLGIDYAALEKSITVALGVRIHEEMRELVHINEILHIPYDMARDNYAHAASLNTTPRSARKRHHKRKDQPNCGPRGKQW